MFSCLAITVLLYPRILSLTIFATIILHGRLSLLHELAIFSLLLTVCQIVVGKVVILEF